MKLKLMMAMMVASIAFCSDGYGQGLLNRMMNRSCCDPAPTCCDTPKDTCGCGARVARFQLRMPNMLCGCGQMGNLFNRGCGCETKCETDCNDNCCGGGLLSRLQFGLRMGNNCGCGCETPVNDCCNQGCGCRLLSTMRSHFASMGCGCNSGCDTGCDTGCGCGGGLLSRLGSRGCGCDRGCDRGCNDCCRPSLLDRLRAMGSCGCDSGCGAAEGSDSVEPKADGETKPQPSESDKGSAIRSRINPAPPRINPSTIVSPFRTIGIGR